MLTLSINNSQYPSQLRRLHSPPRQLYVASDNWDNLANSPMIAVVGTRRPSVYATAVCTQLVRELASKNVCVVSGLALGIDSIAHKAALGVGGKTIAVLPSGINHIYPASHQQLAKAIVANNGALLSEYTPNTKVSFKSNFIERNRIIAGLGELVFIPEAAAKSGSLHTAQFAIESGIDVCALPGQINNPQTEGCHALIKSGAALISCAEDLLNMLNIPSPSHDRPINASTQEEHTILALVTSGVHDADELLVKSHLSAQSFNQTLTMLEITGKLKPAGANQWYLS